MLAFGQFAPRQADLAEVDGVVELGGALIICAAGDSHGALDRLYADVLAFEAALGMPFDHVLHVGDFGVWPDPARVDRATRKHDGDGDFASWLTDSKAVPRPTSFIKGNHEDFGWLEPRRGQEVLPGLRYLGNGDVVDLGAIRVAGVGGCYAARIYDLPAARLEGGQRAHFTRNELERLRGVRDVDVLLLHDAPAGIEIVHSRRSYVTDAAGLRELVAEMRPRLCFFGHHHARVRTEVSGVPCIGLNYIGRPGHLVAVQFDQAGWRVLGEYP